MSTRATRRDTTAGNPAGEATDMTAPVGGRGNRANLALLDHEVSVRRLTLHDLPDAEPTAGETVALPPAAPFKQNRAMHARRAALAQEACVA